MEMQTGPQTVDVDASNFEEVVIQGSQDRLVVVDFWAPWCGPCRTLGPILTEVVASLGDGAVLAKVNVDDNQQLAMAFAVQGIPAVKIVKNGQLVKEFTGALPREQIEEILRPLVPEAAADGEPGDDPLEHAASLAETGDLDGAARHYDEFLSDHPEDGGALLGLARVRQRQGEHEAVEAVVGRVKEGSSEYRPAQALLHLIGMGRTCGEAGGSEACSRRLEADPGRSERPLRARLLRRLGRGFRPGAEGMADHRRAQEGLPQRRRQRGHDLSLLPPGAPPRKRRRLSPAASPRPLLEKGRTSLTKIHAMAYYDHSHNRGHNLP